jgi:hypothetical protein
VPAEAEEEALEESEKRAVGPVSFSLRNSSSSGPLLPSILNTLRPLPWKIVEDVYLIQITTVLLISIQVLKLA